MLVPHALGIGQGADVVLVQGESVRAGWHVTPAGVIVRPLHRLQLFFNIEFLAGFQQKDLKAVRGKHMGGHAARGR